MTYQEPTFFGDAEYSINCTGDAVTGDAVKFERATFSGSYRSATFAGFEVVAGTIIRDSYGTKSGQHTFTIRLLTGADMRIKGRNLYANGVYRAPWPNEAERQAALDEKHSRGDASRAFHANRRD